jgi:hypothetical protein
MAYFHVDIVKSPKNLSQNKWVNLNVSKTFKDGSIEILILR